MAKRVYNANKTSYTDYDESGKQVGGGITGTENMTTNGGIMQIGSKASSSGGSSNSDSMKNAMNSQLDAQTSLYDQQAAAQAAKIRQALETQTQLANNTKQDYTNQMNDAITTLNTERAKIPGQTTSLNNQASATGMTNAQKIRNSLAQMGLLQSGESASQQLLNDTAVQNNINANNLQGQELDMGYGNQIASAQTDLASKIKQINDAIELAQKQGDENALLVLQDAQAKIADATAQNAVAYNQYAYTAGRDAISDRFTQQQFDTQAVQQALDNVYRQNQADLAARQWQSQFDTGNSQWEREFLADQEYKRAALAKSGSSNNGLTSTQIKNLYTSEAYNDIQNALNKGATPNEVKQSILSRSPDYAQMGINVNSLISQVDAIAKSWGTSTDDEGNTVPKTNPVITNSNAASAWNSLLNMWKK